MSFLETAAQDVRYAIRQLRKTPAFTITVLLTLALGIRANAAIFTLANAVLQKNLPVTDPRTLVRIGDTNNCCVGMRLRDDVSLFSTDAYEQLKESTPEFEEMAAMQAGFGFRPVIARRNGAQEAAADASVVGSAFMVNTKPVTIVGIAPCGFFGDRLMSTPPDLYLPINTMPVLANIPYVHGHLAKQAADNHDREGTQQAIGKRLLAARFAARDDGSKKDSCGKIRSGYPEDGELDVPGSNDVEGEHPAEIDTEEVLQIGSIVLAGGAYHGLNEK